MNLPTSKKVWNGMSISKQIIYLLVYCPFKHECKQSQKEDICAFYTWYGVISKKKNMFE